MAQRANISATELLALAPENPLDQADCVEFFTKCMRWAEIERYEPIHETAWMGLVEQDRLCKRNVHLLALKYELEAYIEIYCTETPTPDPQPPVEPDIEEQRLSEDPYYTYPTRTAADHAGSPNINDMPALPADPT